MSPNSPIASARPTLDARSTSASSTANPTARSRSTASNAGYDRCDLVPYCDLTDGIGGSGNTRISVLLIDDQSLVSDMIQRSLRTESDIDFHYCNDPTLAISIAIDLAPSIILQDLVMPDVDGLMLLRWFRLNPDTKDIPMIVLSCKEDAYLKAEAFTYGANDYLIKLPEPAELIARIRYHVQAYENLKALRATTLAAQLQSQQLSETVMKLQNMQAHIIQSEKMTGLGQMVAGIAHEISNPINFIHGNIQHFHHHTDDLLKLLHLYKAAYPIATPEIQASLETLDIEFIQRDLPKVMNSMKTGVDRIRNIIVSLCTFSKLDEIKPKTVDIQDALESTLLLLGHRLESAGVEVKRDYGEVPSISCYPAQLNQVFLHVINNALDAIESQLGPKHLEIQTQVMNNSVQIMISDNGPGIPSEIQSSIFKPFFTTKPVDKGTGLGLSICDKVMQKHQGSIVVHSKVGLGTTLTLQLPIHPIDRI